MRLIGLKAMEGVVSSDALYASDTKVQLEIIIQPVLHNVNVTQVSLDKLRARFSAYALLYIIDNIGHLPDFRETGDNIENVKPLSVHGDLLEEVDVGAMALRVLQELFVRSNAATVRVAMGPLFA
ncbi:hypothetical protein BC936DRAFT_140621 [Jimgerdemannia flammicorona]|uniref:Uncharacterized protein n=2 Tax=Jimgerdemannia flammicorona TaxID=994334 RepID=A0A433AIU8_9FUNG|nr:hypothetical protein BC936DRAFT_140621 [Jimgerdemannia flammicorona]RUS18409.1 hypothetical protein BC938DRAFT_475984 [Jimgerdemannia flammicorona]